MLNFLNFKKLKNLKIFRPLQISFVHTWFTFHKLNKLVKQKANSEMLKNFHPREENFLYVAASCLPYHISGYTNRTHEILKAISNAIEEQAQKQNQNSSNAKQKLFVLTRTGYPWDRKDALQLPEDGMDYNVLDGIRYDHIRTPKNSKLTALYAEEASLEFEKYIIKNNISCVHAASNHVNALPALIAAKRLGVPFQYEMRGLWELTRISRQPEFAKSHNFKLGLDLEAFVAKHADKVFVISEQLSLYIQKNWEIPKERINLLPNCADIDRIKPNLDTNKSDLYSNANFSKDCDNLAQKTDLSNNTICNTANTSLTNSNDNSKVIVIGYAGSLIVYEGLQTLLKAMNILVFKNKMNIHLNVIGDGEYRKTLEDLSQSLDLTQHVTFLGRLSPSKAKSKQDECALICIPREPFEVCKIIPPIKLVEAMAKEKCVVVPDLPVFVDELSISSDNKDNKQLEQQEQNIDVLSNNDSGCIFFKSGNAENLAEVLSNHLSRIDELKERGIKARKYAIANRQWKMFAPSIMPITRKQEDIR